MTDKNKTTVSGGPPPVEKPQEMDGKRHKVSTTVGQEGGVGKPADRQFRIKEASVITEEGNFPPARLIGAGMKAAKKKHGIDPGMPYKELKAKHPEVAKTGWRIAHVFWRKEKADARKSKKKTVTEAWQDTKEKGIARSYYRLGVRHSKEEHNEPTTFFKRIYRIAYEAGKSGKPIPDRINDKRNTVTKVDESRVLNFQQRLKRSRQIKKLAPKLNRGRVRFQYTSPNSSRLLKRSERLARSIVKQRFSPVKGKSYSQLSTSQKIMVDTLVARKQNMIKKLAVRLLPKVRQKAMKRISSFHKNDVDLKIQNLGAHPLAESLNTINALASGKDNKAVVALREKAKKANVEFDKILEVYYDAIAEYDSETSKITAEQYAFNAVNVFVTEQINMITEGLFSSMFIPPTTRAISIPSLSIPRIPPNHSVRVERDVVDENRRSKAVHSYATSEFKKQSKGRYRPNGAFGTKSHEVRTDANIINKQHSEMLRDKEFLKTEYRVGNREFAIRKFGKTAKLPDHHVNKLLDFDNHYHNVTEEYVDEAITMKSHAGKREIDNGKVHDLKDHGGKSYGQLQRVATYKSSSNDLYKLMMPNGQVFKGNGTKPVVKTKQEWETHLNDVEKKHKERMGITENMFMAPPWADPLAIAGEIVKTTGVKNAIPVVTKVVGDSVKEKGKKTISALRARVKQNKERDYD